MVINYFFLEISHFQCLFKCLGRYIYNDDILLIFNIFAYYLIFFRKFNIAMYNINKKYL